MSPISCGGLEIIIKAKLTIDEGKINTYIIKKELIEEYLKLQPIYGGHINCLDVIEQHSEEN